MPAPTRVRDQPVTIALLLTGLLFVTRFVAFARDLPVSLDEAYVQSAAGRFDPSAVVTGIGIAICAVQLLALVLAIAVAVPRMRAGRSSAWVPLLAALISGLITFGLLFVAVATDPPDVPSASASPTTAAAASG